MPDTSMQVCAYGLTKVLGDGTVTLWGNTAGGGGFACGGVQARDTFLLAASLPRLLSRDEPKDAKSSRGSSMYVYSSTASHLAALPAIISHQYRRQAMPYQLAYISIH